MKIQTLKIDGYKNLNNFEIFFEENSSVNALIGVNGSGKSNVLEAVLEIFLALNYKEETDFNFEVTYSIDGETMVGAGKAKKIFDENMYKYLQDRQEEPLLRENIFVKSDNGKLIRATTLCESKFTKIPWKFPTAIFLYYAGETSRLKDRLVDSIDKDFFLAVKQGNTPLIKYVTCMSLADFPVIFLANFLFKMDISKKIFNLTQITNILTPITFYLSRPSWNKSAPLTEDSFWNATGILATTLHELKDIGIFRRIDNHSAEIFVNSLVDLKALYENSYDMFLKLKMLMQADLLDSVSYFVIKNEDESNVIPVYDLSEGEQQLSLLLCFLTVTREYRSLFLLDEMDAYLHPSWQREFTSLVSDIEIRGQVLMTTHSPLTLGKMNKENIRILKDGEVYEPSADTMNRDIVEVLGEIMDVGARPKEVAECISNFKKAVKRNDIDSALKYETELRKDLKASDPFLLTMEGLLRRMNR